MSGNLPAQPRDFVRGDRFCGCIRTGGPSLARGSPGSCTNSRRSEQQRRPMRWPQTTVAAGAAKCPPSSRQRSPPTVVSAGSHGRHVPWPIGLGASNKASIRPVAESLAVLRLGRPRMNYTRHGFERLTQILVPRRFSRRCLFLSTYQALLGQVDARKRARLFRVGTGRY